MDWISSLPESSAHSNTVNSVDWSATPLGLPAAWPLQLRHMIGLAMADPTPAAVMWGEDLTMIYNEAFVEFAGSKHPALMGGSPIVEYAETGKPTRHNNVRLLLNRHGYTEECYVTYTFIPIVGPENTVVGFYHTAVETTDQVLSDRRTKTLLAIGDNATAATNIEQYWNAVLSAFESNQEDVPFILAYSFRDHNDNGSLSTGSDSASASASGSGSSGGVRLPLSCTLAGARGRPILHIPLSFNVRDEEDVFVQNVRESIRSGTMKRIDQSMGMPDWVFPSQPTEESAQFCTSALIIPIRPTTTNDPEGRNVLGFLVCGLSPDLNYGEKFEKYSRLWSIQLATSAASVVLFEQEVHRQKQLTEQLLVSRKIAQDTEVKFSRFAELSNVAMWITNTSGQQLYSNKAWKEQTKNAVEDPESATWIEIVSEGSRASFEHNWGLLLDERIPVSFECQLKSSRNNSDAIDPSTQSSKWILCTAFPEIADDGSIKAIWGCNTDISHQKWAEIMKEQRLLDVLESKRQTENFIDITSHEMRNPLSAIIHCADGINDIISESAQDENATLSNIAVESIAESAETITLCAQHQKRIVDDILTLSKLDASLLVVSPTEVDPVAIAQRALLLHQQEIQAAQMSSQLRIDQSYHDFNIGRVLLDPSRILQILMNLITNSIKFTRHQPERAIVLSLGASPNSPGEGDTNAEYFPPKEIESEKVLAESDQHPGETVFLSFSVHDTGCGLTDAEIQKLFLRFSQASPKTHVQYGGSGLGLFICKELTELQGGRIGVSSIPGQGSNFKFYVKARRAGSAQEISMQGISKSQNDNMEAPKKKTRLAENLSRVDPESHISNEVSNLDANTLHVLVVEDNQINQKVMASQLRKGNCIVHTANHGGDALDFLQKSTFAKDASSNAIPLSIVLLDLEMPVMDGLTCVSHIRRWQTSRDIIRHVPVLAITANARREQVERAIAHGMDDVITKPFKIAELFPKMRSVIQKASS